MVGVTKDVAEAFGSRPINPPSRSARPSRRIHPATAASGLKVRQIIVKINGQPLTRMATSRKNSP